MLPLEVALLFIASLNRERWSVLAVFALCGWVGLRWCARPVVDVAFALRLGLLAMFAAVFFAVASSFGYYAGADPAKWFAVIVGLYALGYSAGADPPGAQMWKLLAVVGGFATFAFLSVEGALQSPTLFATSEIAERQAASYWAQNAVVGGTGLGALGSLAMCLLPAVLARPAPGMRAVIVVPWKGLVVVVAALGFVTNIALQNRTPVVAFAGTVLATGVLMTYLRPTSWTKRLMAAAVLAGLIVVAFNVGPIVQALAPEYGLARRFVERGAQTERYGAWTTVLASLPHHPFGGRLADRGGLQYAHNLWLDVAVDAGVLPALLLLAFQASHIGAIKRLVRNDVPGPMRVALIGVGLSFLATFMVEPALQFSVMYFAASGYLLGSASAIARPYATASA
jgi:hypothetical protein